MSDQMTQHAHIPAAGLNPAYAYGKLVPGVHYRLVEELDRIAREAGVTPGDITGQNYHLTDVEREYLTGFRKAGETGALGIVYIGQHEPSVLLRGRSIVGALTRNFIKARLIPREELIHALFGTRGDINTADCVVIPDFHYGDAPVSTKRALSSYLIGRAARGKQTILGVPNQKVMKEAFGDDTSLYLKHYEVVTGVVQNAI